MGLINTQVNKAFEISRASAHATSRDMLPQEWCWEGVGRGTVEEGGGGGEGEEGRGGGGAGGAARILSESDKSSKLAKHEIGYFSSRGLTSQAAVSTTEWRLIKPYTHPAPPTLPPPPPTPSPNLPPPPPNLPPPSPSPFQG